MRAVLAATCLLALAADGGSGSYVATGRSYDFVLFNSGSTPWRSFSLVAPPGLAFVGGTTGNDGSVTCTVGPPTQIVCAPIAATVMPPQGHLTFVATMTAPTVCGVTFQLFVSSSDAAPYSYTRAADVSETPGCGTPRVLTPPALRGKAVVGGTLRATPPTWSSAPTRVRYRWERCTGSRCTAIRGATRLVLVLTKRDAGRTVRLVATATIDGTIVRTSSEKHVERLRLPATISAPRRR
jgi:hypothetical protein